MIMQHIDRSRSTGGGMAASFVLHGGLLLLLALLAGRQAAIIHEGGELTEIAYIEAKYGEDVAAKVKLKEKPRLRPEPPGRGVNTDSAMKAPAEASPEAPRPEPRQTLQPKPRMTAPTRIAPEARPVAAKVEVAAPTMTPRVQQKTLAVASQLSAKAPRPKARTIVDANRLPDAVQKLAERDVSGPAAATRNRTTGAFAPQKAGLKSKSGTVALGEDVLAAGDTGRATRQVAEASAALAAGGGLKSAGETAYRAPSAGLAPASGSRGGAASSKGVVDVDGPRGAGGGQKSGRKTMLNYGSGGGGRGGSLSGRRRIAEPAVKQEIVAQAATNDKAQQAVADVKIDAKGVNMTISGQIQGRKILKSVAPVYSAIAKKKGWEGVVAVHFTVKADGRVKDNMYFDQTSVHRDLNQAAMAAIKQFVFASLGPDQAAVEQWGVITIVFRLN